MHGSGSHRAVIRVYDERAVRENTKPSSKEDHKVEKLEATVASLVATVKEQLAQIQKSERAR